jgi:hypothetical protein
VLGKYLFAQLDILVLGLLLGGTSVDNLLPLVVLGLALIILSVYVVALIFNVAWGYVGVGGREYIATKAPEG